MIDPRKISELNEAVKNKKTADMQSDKEMSEYWKKRILEIKASMELLKK